MEQRVERGRRRGLWEKRILDEIDVRQARIISGIEELKSANMTPIELRRRRRALWNEVMKSLWQLIRAGGPI